MMMKEVNISQFVYCPSHLYIGRLGQTKKQVQWHGIKYAHCSPGLKQPGLTMTLRFYALRGKTRKKKKRKADKTIMKIFLLMNPPTVTAQERKVAMVRNRPIFYKPERVKAAKAELIRYLRPFKPDAPYDGAIELHVVWLFPKGKSHKHNEWRITKPDTDNLEKMLKDCMTEIGFWKDDAQVVKELVEKRWSDEPCGISIEMGNLEKFYKGGS